MRKRSGAKIMAILALLWILVWIIWTWILIVFSPSNTNSTTVGNSKTISQDDLQKIINNSKSSKNLNGSWNTNTWIINK
jgi:cell division septal protein FtsQ